MLIANTAIDRVSLSMNGANKYLITSVTYRLSKTYQPKLDYGNIRAALAEQSIENPTAAELRQTITDIRNAKLPDPKIIGNAGSFFKNPVVSAAQFAKIQKQVENLPHFPQPDGSVKLAAGWLIDQCHLKRFSNRWCSCSSTTSVSTD